MNRGAKLLAGLLAERGSQKRLAEELGIDQGYLSKIASAERVPGLDARRKLKALGIEMEAWDDAVSVDDDEPASEPKPKAAKGEPPVKAAANE